MKYTADRKLEYYEGNFEAFLRQCSESFTAANMEEALGVAAEGSADKFAPPVRKVGSTGKVASMASMASSGGVGSEELLESEYGEQQESVEEDDEALDGPKTKVKLSFPVPGKLVGVLSSTKPVMEMSNVWFGYNWEPGMPYTLKGVSGKLTLSSRVALVGRNGAGKSTFMNLLCGELSPNPDPDGKEGTVFQHRYRFGDYDELYQKRLEQPQSDDEAKM